MFLAEPSETAYDLRFQVAGIPVRVHPLFWVVGAVLGAQSGDGIQMLIWVGVLFVSILIHELGHAFTMRLFGEGARVVLYLMGGLAISDSSPWGFSPSRKSRGPREQILISAAGPGAGFLLAALVVAVVYAVGGVVEFHVDRFLIPAWDLRLPPAANQRWQALADSLLWVNIFWGLVNLLPVFPLDGGQIAREVLSVSDPWNGTVRSLWLSVITGTVVAVAGLALLGRSGIFVAVLFGSLAFSSYQALQRMGGGGLGGRPW